MKVQITSVVLLLTLSGCTVHNPFVPTTEEKIEKAEYARCKMDAEINQQTRQLVTGVKEVLESKEPLKREEQISLDLSSQAERLLGGEPIEKIDVTVLLDLYDSDREEYERVISRKEKTITILKTSELDNQTTVEALQKQLKQERAKRSLWQWIKNLGVSSIILMIFAVILLLIFAPNVLGWIVSKIPSLVLFLGVTSSRVVKSLVKGVQKARSHIAELPEGQKLDKYQILNMIDTGLREEADGETTNTVDVLRKKYHLESISQRLRSPVQASANKI